MPCVDPQDKFCGARSPRRTTRAPITFPDDLPDEFFYMSADADALDERGRQQGLAITTLEGAFANGGPDRGDQIVFTPHPLPDQRGPAAEHRLQGHAPVRHGHRDVRRGRARCSSRRTSASPRVTSHQAIKGRVGPFLDLGLGAAQRTSRPPATSAMASRRTPSPASELGTNFVRIQRARHRRRRRLDQPEPVQHHGRQRLQRRGQRLHPDEQLRPRGPRRPRSEDPRTGSAVRPVHRGLGKMHPCIFTCRPRVL